MSNEKASGTFEAPGRRAVSPMVTDMITRIEDPREWNRWARQVEHAGHCARPVRVHGRAFAVDTSTGEVRAEYSSAAEPDGTLLLACKDRRAAVCPACSRLYRADVWHLVVAGLRGRSPAEPPTSGTIGTAVPASVSAHPVVFATFTAPSFGPVHRAGVEGRACRPRRARPRCVHAMPLWCGDVHETGDARTGTPLCPRCYDYPGHVLWQASVSELWRRTMIDVYQRLARLATDRTGRPVSVRAVRRLLRVSYVKVAEWQRRAAIHLHAVIRLDGIDPDDPAAIVPPPSWADANLLEQAIRDAATRIVLRLPTVDQCERSARWGAQFDVKAIMLPERAAGYVAKYATKTAADTLAHLPVNRFSPAALPALEERGLSPHVSALVSTCFQLARNPDLAGLRLSSHAHTLGFGGHFLTKSQRYATTMTALRADRRTWRTTSEPDETHSDPWTHDNPATAIVGDWRMVGLGYARLGDVEFAETLRREHQDAREHKRITADPDADGPR